MVELVISSHRQLNETFTRTYGVLYERNADLFRDFFADIGKFYDW